jgi:hypothetical protein
MSTATEPTLNCDYCSSDTALPDVAGRSWQQWQCPHCSSWNDWGHNPAALVEGKRASARVLLGEKLDHSPKSVRRYTVHVAMGKAVTVYAQDEREAEILAIESVEGADYANVIGIDKELPSE